MPVMRNLASSNETRLEAGDIFPVLPVPPHDVQCQNGFPCLSLPTPAQCLARRKTSLSEAPCQCDKESAALRLGRYLAGLEA